MVVIDELSVLRMINIGSSRMNASLLILRTIGLLDATQGGVINDEDVFLSSLGLSPHSLRGDPLSTLRVSDHEREAFFC